MYADLYERKRELEAQLDDEDTRIDQQRQVSKRLRSIYKALGEEDQTMGEDPLIDKWERELEADIRPDLNEKL